MSKKPADGGSYCWLIKPSGAQLAKRRAFLHVGDFSNQDATSKEVVGVVMVVNAPVSLMGIQSQT